MEDYSFFINLALMIPPLVVAVILHEIAHGYVALKLGDPTARDMGRLTLNPIKHIDPFLTILVPGVLIFSGSPVVFGGAKPVPVNPFYFKNPRRGMLWVAAAGPITNFILAAISYGLLVVVEFLHHGGQLNVLIAWPLEGWFAYSLLINIVLALFNLLPVPPLDGGRIMVGILAERAAVAYAKLERFGLILVVALIYLRVPELVLSPVIEFISEHIFK